MTPPSRRDVLRASGVGFAAVAGCAAQDEPSDETTTQIRTWSTTRRTETETTRETTTTNERTDCTPESLPVDGWPLPGRDSGNAHHAPSANGPAETPSVRWKLTAERPDVDGHVETRFTDPVVTADYLFVGKALLPGTETQMPDENQVHAYDRASGERAWTYSTGDEAPRTVAVMDDSVYVSTWNSVHALDRTEGVRRWTFEAENAVAGAVPVDGRVYVAGERGTVSGVRDDGSVVWTASVGERISDRPAVRGGTVFVGSDGRTLTALRTEDGRELWSITTDSGESNAYERVWNVTPTGCGVFVTIGGDLYAIDDGDVQWRATGSYRLVSIDGETVYAGTTDGDVRAFSPTDGTVRWDRFYGSKGPNRVDGIAGLTVGSETVFASVVWGGLRALGTDDGDEQWSLSGDWEHPGTPVVVDDSILLSQGKYLTLLA